jgi:hypothetical protein
MLQARHLLCFDAYLPGADMTRDRKTAAELEAMILSGLGAQGIDAASIEVYAIDEPGIDMTWTVRRLRLNKTSEVKVEGALKRVVFALAEQYELATDAVAASSQSLLDSAAKTERGA